MKGWNDADGVVVHVMIGCAYGLTSHLENWATTLIYPGTMTSLARRLQAVFKNLGKTQRESRIECVLSL